MKEIFVPYKIAKKLKEIRFDEPCIFHYYKDNINIDLEDYIERQFIYFEEIDIRNYNNYDVQVSAPTWEQVFTWFREKGLHFSMIRSAENLKYFFRLENKNGELLVDTHDQKWASYEECREQLILKMIEIYKNK